MRGGPDSTGSAIGAPSNMGDCVATLVVHFTRREGRGKLKVASLRVERVRERRKKITQRCRGSRRVRGCSESLAGIRKKRGTDRNVCPTLTQRVEAVTFLRLRFLRLRLWRRRRRISW